MPLHRNALGLPPVLNAKHLKVSLLTETFPPEINGVSFTLARLAGELSNLGAEVQVLRPARESSGNDQSEWTEIDLPSRPITNYPELRFGLPCGRLLKKLWRKDRPDIVYFATEGPAGYSGLKTCRSLGIPSVSGFHTNFDLYLKHYRISILKPLVDRYLKWFHNRTSATFAPTPWMISELREKGYNNVKMLSRGVDRGLFSPRKRSLQLRKSWGVKQKEERVLLTVSRIAAEKNLRLTCQMISEAIKNDKADHGVVVGDGPQKQSLEKSFPRLRFTGCLDKKSLSEHYASADLFLFASTTETFGNVITEALASGLPTVGYDYAAASEFITEGENGFIAPLGNEEALRKKFEVALSLAGSSRIEASLNARDSTVEADWRAIVEKFRDDLIGIVKKRNISEITRGSATTVS